MTDRKYLEYGCGWAGPAPEGWRSFDASPTLRLERLPLIGRFVRKNRRRFPANVEFGDIVRGLPVAEASFDGVYCSHVLEHLALADFRTALNNTFRLLKPGGVFRLVVPDLAFLAHRYVNDPSPDAAHKFMEATNLGSRRRERGAVGFAVAWFGHSRHLWMWDFEAMREELRRAGFTELRKARIGDAEDPAFREVEDEGRWENCLGMECKRPIAGPRTPG